MASRKQAAEPFAPPYYEATQDIYLGDPGSGAMRVCAYRAGDQVHPGVVEAHGLGGMVRVPDVFGGQAPPQEELPVETPPADELPAEGGRE